MSRLRRERPREALPFGAAPLRGGAEQDPPVLFGVRLQASLVPENATGSATPTFTRATAAEHIDFEGLHHQVLSGEARFQGARRIRNYLGVQAVDIAAGTDSHSGSGAAVTKTSNYAAAPDGTMRASRLQCDIGAGTLSSDTSMVELAGTAFTGNQRQSIFARSTDGISTYNIALFNTAGGPEKIVVGPTWTRVATPVRSVTTATLRVGLAGSVAGRPNTADILVFGAQSENVTGQTNTAPGEFIDPTADHGSGSNNVKYFDTLPANSVDAATTLVTEATGAHIDSSQSAASGGVAAGVVDAVGPRGYLAEGAATNLALQSNAFTTTWTNVFSPNATQNAVGIDGVTSAWTLTDNDGANLEGVTQTIGALTAANYTVSLFIKKTSGATSFPTVQMYANTPVKAAAVTVDTNNGVATVWTAYTGQTIVASSAGITSANSNFWRVTLTFAATTDSWAITVYPAATANATQSTGTFDATVQGSAVITGAQLETGPIATSYIPTTTVAVARNADVLTFPTLGNINAAQGTVTMEVTAPFSSQTGATFLETNSADNQPILYLFAAGVLLSSFDGTTQVHSLPFTFSSSVQKIAAAWGNGVLNNALNGTVGTPGVFDGALDLGTNMLLGERGSGGVGATTRPYGTIRNVRIYDRALSTGRLQGMTQ